MNRLFGGLAVFALVALCGCASKRCAYYADSPHHVRPATNTLFGGSRDEIWLAQLNAGRSGWPSVETGLIIEDVTFFYEDRNDRQSFYDRFGGGTRQETQSFRVGTLVR